KQAGVYDGAPLNGGQSMTYNPTGTGTGTGGTGTGTGGTGGTTGGIQTSGGSKWTTNPVPPLHSTPMTDASHQGQWKVVDSTGKNVAANFTSKAAADAWIAQNGGGTGGTGAGTGTGTGGSSNIGGVSFPAG